jgi:hypothetical protein
MVGMTILFIFSWLLKSNLTHLFSPLGSGQRKTDSCNSLATMCLAAREQFWLTTVAVKAFQPRRIRHRRGLLVGGLMLSLYLMLQVLAGSAVLHHWLHHDSNSPDHQCVIKQVAEGEVLVTPAEAIELRPEILSTPVVVAPASCCVRADVLLPLGRAPPVSPA